MLLTQKVKYKSLGFSILFMFSISLNIFRRPNDIPPKNAAIAQLGERKTEDLKVTGSITLTCKSLGFILY